MQAEILEMLGFVREQIEATKKSLQISSHYTGPSAAKQQLNAKLSGLQKIESHLVEQIDKPMPKENYHYNEDPNWAKALNDSCAIMKKDLLRIQVLEKKHEVDIFLELYSDGSGNIVLNFMQQKFENARELQNILTEIENNGL